MLLPRKIRGGIEVYKPMSLTFNHHTIFTGDIYRRPVESVSPDVAKKVLESVKYALGEEEPIALYSQIDPEARFLLREFPGGGLKCTVFYGNSDKPVLAFIIAKETNKATRKQYGELLEMDMTEKKNMLTMPSAPFCSVALTYEAANCPELLKWIGDCEGCMAIAWLYGDKLQKMAAVEKTKERLWQWLMFGGDCVVDQEMIDILGKRYLIDFIKNAKKNIDSKANIPILKAGSAPMFERLEQLRKMIQ